MKTELIKDTLKSADLPNGIDIVLLGSIARQEAEKLSDIDYFILYKDHTIDPSNLEIIRKKVAGSFDKIGEKPPSQEGAFAAIVHLESLYKNIGGNKDTNENFTRRILTILESKSTVDNDIFNFTQDYILKRYISDQITDHQLALFLLNDIIRYYRTVCVDFEFKTQENSKPWGERNIKLIFSRKLIYFSGLTIVSETAQKTSNEKREAVKNLIQLTPIERIFYVFGDSCIPALMIYENFLEQINNTSIRETLSQTDRVNRKENQEFRSLKNLGYHFSWELLSLFNQKYHRTHPIHNSILL